MHDVHDVSTGSLSSSSSQGSPPCHANNSRTSAGSSSSNPSSNSSSTTTTTSTNTTAHSPSSSSTSSPSSSSSMGSSPLRELSSTDLKFLDDGDCGSLGCLALDGSGLESILDDFTADPHLLLTNPDQLLDSKNNNNHHHHNHNNKSPSLRRNTSNSPEGVTIALPDSTTSPTSLSPPSSCGSLGNGLHHLQHPSNNNPNNGNNNRSILHSALTSGGQSFGSPSHGVRGASLGE